ncbi:MULTISPECIES: Lsr2 family protein [unclassified Amycolatopsis]|uniref:histone-like nucleoid-structuring protein Lsr2 n=1 Tax=unclassified Amycolatopsis TaxID=2618356 RepID=UPI001FF569ED|nr:MULTISPECIES: Lsr2 family protein [unclassified Amycolatopsis]UOZ04182.1 Lsr2 family protein [Amycolatopsis sp. WQ 127309]WSJ79667.1 Lsr2 family protein [Amycolatopsis sp. NBC_01307]WSK76838.1 Lsr2 family protein [Amycolatopsis sp. NBC_01286]
MAQRVHVEMVDDLDGSEANQTVPFALDGVSFEIDLSEENASALRDELARYVGAARRIGGRKVRLATGQSLTGASGSGTDRERNRQIREWAQDNGYEVAERGRLSSEIIAGFEEHQAAAAEPAEAKPARKRATRKKA